MDSADLGDLQETNRHSIETTGSSILGIGTRITTSRRMSHACLKSHLI